MSIIQPDNAIDKALPPHIKRVLQEGDALAQKLLALLAFMDTDVFKAMDPTDSHLLVIQSQTMQSYLQILTLRLNRERERVNNRKTGIIATGPGLRTGGLDRH